MKKFLLSLIVGCFGFISFGYCSNVATLLDTTDYSASLTKDVWQTIYDFNNSDSYSVCFTFNTFQGSLRVGIGSRGNQEPGTNFIYWNDRAGNYVCINKGSVDRYLLVMPLDTNTSLNGDFFSLNGLLDTELPLMTSSECQSEYDLIPISSIDQNYCVENDLCPISSGSSSRSELVINNIAHEGRPLINIAIPDYITRDYTVDENQYDIYVGSGYDQDYIDSVLKINSYRPDSKDFTQIFVSGLTLIFPYIFIALLIMFIWKLLKRIFK